MGICFFGGGVGLSRGLRAFDVPQGATCGLRMEGHGWLGNYALHSARGRGRGPISQ